jgi:HEPN domain-containing protein
MKNESSQWVEYSCENLAVAQLALDAGHLNACLQNCQQAVEKAMKAVIIGQGLVFRKTHNIHELNEILRASAIDLGLSAEDCNLLDAIYLPSKYPLGSALPDAEPDAEICRICLQIADKVSSSAKRYLQDG